MLISYLPPALTLLSCHALVQCWLFQDDIKKKTKAGIMNILEAPLLPPDSLHNKPLPHSSSLFSCSLFISTLGTTVFLSLSQLD